MAVFVVDDVVVVVVDDDDGDGGDDDDDLLFLVNGMHCKNTQSRHTHTPLPSPTLRVPASDGTCLSPPQELSFLWAVCEAIGRPGGLGKYPSRAREKTLLFIYAVLLWVYIYML